MSLVQDFLELITTQQGALVYYLVTLFAIQMIAAVALGHWQRGRDEAATRLLVMGVGLFLARAALMVVAVLDSIGLVSSATVFPPLERFLNLLTAILIIWAFLPVLERDPRLSTTLLLVTTLIAAGTYAAFASLWPAAEAQGVAYNGYWQERVWELSTTAVLGLALVANLVWRGNDWGWLVCLLALLLVGHILQLVTPTADVNTAGWVRLANLAVLPLLAALIYRRALEPAKPQFVEDDKGKDEEAPPRGAGIWEAIQLMKANDGFEAGLNLVAPSIAQNLRADMVAVGLMVPGPIEVLRVVALHPATGVMAAKQAPTLFLSKHPLLAMASHAQRQERAIEHRNPSPVNGLYRRLGFDESGPLLVQPMIAGKRVIGLILVGNPVSQRVWDPRDERMLQAIAHVLISVIAGDGGREPASGEQLTRARNEAQRLASRVEDLQEKLEQQRRRIEELSTKLRLREKEAAKHKEASATLNVWQREVRELAEARDQLQVKLSQWQEKAERLSQTKTELEERLDQMQSAEPQSYDGHAGGTPGSGAQKA